MTATRRKPRWTAAARAGAAAQGGAVTLDNLGPAAQAQALQQLGAQTAASITKSAAPQRQHKYGAHPTIVDDIRFASKFEAEQYTILKLRERAGEITGLTLQVAYPCIVNGTVICTWIADFKWREVATGSCVVADAKGFRTKEYKVKKKLVEALYGFQILEISRSEADSAAPIALG